MPRADCLYRRSEDTVKRHITQQELDEVLGAVAPPIRAEERANQTSKLASVELLPGVVPAETASVGVEVGPDRSVLVYASARHTILHHTSLNQGHREPEKLAAALRKALGDSKQFRLPVHLTISGGGSHYVFAKLPKLPRTQLFKAFRVKMKQAGKDELGDLQHLTAGTPRKGEDQTHYLAAALNGPMHEKILQQFRRLRLRPASWDLDLLCYARAANLAWQKSEGGSSTRFIIILDWDQSSLLVSTTDGRMMAMRLPIGLQAFLENLMARREATMPAGSAPKSWLNITTEDIEIRERKVLANQAVHDIYVPLVQQIKTQLFAICNEHEIPPPTHLGVLTGGTNVFHLVDSLAADLGLKLINTESYFPSDTAAAFGATLWPGKEARLNFMPATKTEALRAMGELVKNLRMSFSKGGGLKDKLPSLPEGSTPIYAAGAAVLGLAIGIPVWQRMQVSKRVEAARAEMASLAGDRERIKKGQERETGIDRKMAMVRAIETNSVSMSRAIHELISVLPADIKLQTLAFRDRVLTLKGQSQSPDAVQGFLKSALEFRFISEPTPVGIRRDKDGIEFELTFKVRS